MAEQEPSSGDKRPASVDQTSTHGFAGESNQEKKRKKWEAKQAKKKEIQERQSERQAWIEKCQFCSQISLDQVQKVRQQLSEDSDGDKYYTRDGSLSSLLRPYLDLKDGPTKHDKAKMFIAEGTETVRVLVQQCLKSNTNENNSSVQVVSLLVKPATLFDEPVKLINDIQKLINTNNNGVNEKDESSMEATAPPFHVLVGTEDSLSAVAGFHIARGALACGIVPQRDESWLDSFLDAKEKMKSRQLRILALDGISDTANLGSMIRCSAAFGIDVIVLSNDCCDAWYRRSVRVSMGHIFNVPIVRVDDLAGTIRNNFSSSQRNITSYAAVIDLDADLVLEQIGKDEIPQRWCCVMGNEGNGISKNVAMACTSRLRINMVHGVDSLSVPIATGILLHGIKEREKSYEQ